MDMARKQKQPVARYIAEYFKSHVSIFEDQTRHLCSLIHQLCDSIKRAILLIPFLIFLSSPGSSSGAK